MCRLCLAILASPFDCGVGGNVELNCVQFSFLCVVCGNSESMESLKKKINKKKIM